MTALSKLALVRASEPTRTRYATLSSEILLARFGLAQHLVCAWTLDEAGKLRCEWAHRPLAARLASEEARTPEPIPVNGKAAGVHDPDFG